MTTHVDDTQQHDRDVELVIGGHDLRVLRGPHREEAQQDATASRPR